MEPTAQHVSLVHRAERYWAESRRPLVSLAFIAPLLAVYEAGVFWWRVPQNGADKFLQTVLNTLGFSQYLIAPALIVVILLGWQYLARLPWRFSPKVLSGMAVESIFLGAGMGLIWRLYASAVPCHIGETLHNAAARAVGFLGAGIYEELLFRLILLSLLAWAFRRATDRPRLAVILAILVSSVLFSAAHHVGPYGEPLGEQRHLLRFVFRIVAGAYFSVVYVCRGFGVAVGSHAAYDIFVGCTLG
jgi:membrane protease YdiL (CAAX protease family)